MAKKGKSNKKVRKQVARKHVSKAPAYDWLNRQAADDGSKWRFGFIGASVVIGLCLVLMSLGSGINGDDKWQNDYETKLLSFYSSFGADSSALNVPDGSMHYYGGLFDIVSGVTNRALGNDNPTIRGYHTVRHVINSLFGFLVILFAGLFARRIGGWKLGILTMAMLFLSPRFTGHALMNPKDIPFAAGYMMGLYFMLEWLRDLPKPKWSALIGLAVGLGIAISSRAGGLLLVAYMGLFALIHYFLLVSSKKIEAGAVVKYFMYGMIPLIIGMVITVLFWPFALVNPIAHPLEALGELSKRGVGIRLLFEGGTIFGDNVPWYYPLKWMLITVPLFMHIGLTAALVLVRKWWKELPVVPLALAGFAAIFPIVYIISKGSTLHDGWRHLIFVYAPLVILAATAFWTLMKLASPKFLGYAAIAIFALSALEPAIFTARNTHLPYVYFNPLVGGVSGAFGNYETDYWGVSTKQAIDWMEKEGILKVGGLQEGEPRTVLMTNSFYPAFRYVPKYGNQVKIDYAKYENRHTKDYDYGLWISRFSDGSMLRAGNWPQGTQVIHEVKVNGVPMAVVTKKQDPRIKQATDKLKGGDAAGAALLYEQVLQNEPDNELVLLGLGDAYLNSRRYEEAKQIANRTLALSSENLRALNQLGLIAINQNDAASAMGYFQKAVDINYKFSTAWYYMAMIKMQSNNLNGALADIDKCIEHAPRFKQGYALAAQIYQKMGNSAKAAQYQNAANSL